jgi:hypothetical protein
MPINYRDYAPDWKTRIRPDILEREGHCCKFCGVPNYAIIRIHPFKIAGLPLADIVDQPPFKQLKAVMGADAVLKISDKEASRFCLQNMKQGMDCQIGGFRYVQIVLTVAHLDHDIDNNDYSNLAALCQKCHLNYDKDHHSKNSNATREAKKAAKDAKNGVLRLF